MADYKERLDEWQRAAQRKAREIDEKYDIRGRVEQGARVAQDRARRGVDGIANGAERAKSEASRLSEDLNIPEGARRAAKEASRRARQAGRIFRTAAGSANTSANQAFGEAKGYYQRASRLYSTSAGLTRASAAATSAVFKARNWVSRNPGKAAVVTLSIVTGVRLGSSFPSLDAVLLGSHPHWFTHSAIPVYGLRKLSQKYDEYLKKQEKLIASGNLEKAEKERIKFQRDAAKYVGAPLLGAFSCAAGVAIWAQIFQPGRITGAPISWLLGGNPVLDGVWLFANGVICFHQGYKFFMIALTGQEEVERFVSEIKGLLPSGEAA